jgi:hypothetical protein
MALNPGDILFTSYLTDGDSTGTDEGFSFIATTNIPAGEVIRIWDADSSPTFFEFTVGPGGLSPLDRVSFSEDANTASIIDDPSGGTISTQITGTWTNSVNEPIVATSDHSGTQEVIAGLGIQTTWDNSFPDLQAAGVSRSLVDSFLGSPSPVLSNILGTSTGANNNIMFAGTNLSGYDDESNWTGTDTQSTSVSSPNVNGTTFATQDADIVCFAAGTLIATPEGERAVENLRFGELVCTEDGREVPVKWVGRQTIVKRFAGERAQLVKISKGALGNHTDLFVTGDHGMVIDGYILNASVLVNGLDIDWVSLDETPERQTVFHVETDKHDVIIANGAPSETFLDVRSRQVFDNFQEYLDLHGSEELVSEMSSRLRISAKRLLPASLRAPKTA